MANTRQKKIQMIKEEVKAETKETGVKEVEAGFEVVKLISEGNEKIGNHNIFLKRGCINFVDGVAKVRNEIAAELRELGMVE